MKKNPRFYLDLTDDSVFNNIGLYVEKINAHDGNTLTINSRKDRRCSLAFLNDVKNLERIEELDVFGKVADVQSIYRFKNVIKLSLMSTDSDQLIDLSEFKNLKQLTCDSLDIVENIDKSPITVFCTGGKLQYDKVTTMSGLKSLCVYQPKDIDFSKLASLQNIIHFQFTQGNITSLKGIEQFKNLNFLYMYYCRSLRSVRGIEQCKNLKELFLESCGKIEDTEAIAECTALEAFGIPNYKTKSKDFLRDMKCKQTLKCLDINNCGAIPSLDFINEFPNLEAIFFMDTNVLDGDMRPCLRLQKAATFIKRHYNVKKADLPHQYGIDHWLPGAL